MTYYSKGEWNALCQRCGFKFKSGDLSREWTGLRVCGDCWEPRHPQDHTRGVRDRQSPPWTSPEPVDVFLDPGDVTEDDF